MFRDEQFIGRIWQEANRRLSAAKPDVEREIRNVESQIVEIEQRTDRYFEAFETGNLQPETCERKVSELNSCLEQLESERTALESRRESLELPAIDHDMLAGLIDRFEDALARRPNHKKAHSPQAGEEGARA